MRDRQAGEEKKDSLTRIILGEEKKKKKKEILQQGWISPGYLFLFHIKNLMKKSQMPVTSFAVSTLLDS